MNQATAATTLDAPLEALIDRIRAYNPTVDTELLARAYTFARQAHAGQVRDSGESYFQHPVEVARILAELQVDVATIAAGLLHDVLEDTPVTVEELTEHFGPEIARLVDGVTKLSKIPFQSREAQQAENLRKMFLAMAEDLRVVLIKLADRLHNMRTLRHLPPERQRKVARETLEIYAPLAHRLGIWQLKWEMEDLALRYLDPTAYYQLVQAVAKKRTEREGELEEVMEILRRKLAEMGIAGRVQGRPKHFYSIYQKMRTQGRSLDEIYDLMAVRVIVGDVKDCYAVLGMVHSLWKPIPGRFKDFVAMPKSNLYQSLHTTVIGPRGEPLEVQIRTQEMHEVAERGIAAHWLYKEKRTASAFDAKVAWLRQVMEWLREMKDPHEFMETLKIDLFEDEVFVFTPKGDVKNLPAGSTPVDFAFSVHTDIGLRCAGAKVNGRLVPLHYRLRNGEIVEIVTGKHAQPSQDWLNFVKTSKARSKIRSYLKEARREQSLAHGREMLEREARRLGIDLAEAAKEDALAQLSRRYGLASVEDLYSAIGFGRISAAQALARLVGKEELAEHAHRRPETPVRPGRGETDAGSSIVVEGADNLLVRFSKCCSPVPGDAIVGYITRGRGISVHRADCPNLQQMLVEPDRQVQVRWRSVAGVLYPVDLQIEAHDRVNLLSNIINAISDGKTNIEAVQTRTTRHHLAIIHVVVDIDGMPHLADLMRRLRQVEGVIDVRRAQASSPASPAAPGPVRHAPEV
ncbi:bifunctional (p)ppGpp synthetase/guanosine-3',5'-bis(diphosphate) 3'-pyrophosphohydrolase [Carboxydochorda subterranea]|uniref:GTP diphosphokinase n=1 Tax=Carboxydichorda subterranea TaxID=3109565 RepID=A0ABZ1C206_9FIRM|nr:bifunctional (p)ppGpp synthetase/guanosine-3',5'-bis(diphosphate) 3'-pyrophosphohydrolase [Limnochorda sp. L945t]WRP18298.1 bifunctional (p)ppGpp synthetase/guanosine-3',5'-bis(diphosphate) 3'-pyrophosphohydrolase [Limnochorda sp. L945t]